MEFTDKSWYWVKFNGNWTMAQYLKSGRLQRPSAEWRIDGDLYLPNRIEDIVQARIMTPSEWETIHSQHILAINHLDLQTKRNARLMKRNLWQRILNKDV